VLDRDASVIFHAVPFHRSKWDWAQSTPSVPTAHALRAEVTATLDR